MGPTARILRAGTPFTPCVLLTGCARHTVPTLSVFGAYFPIWILCGVLGVAAAGVARILLVTSGGSDFVPAQLVVCTAVGVIAACLAWLWLGR